MTKNILPSWRASESRKNIIDFVTKVTKENGKDYVEPKLRIATFDNDGTLWCEKPTIQIEFLKYQLFKNIHNNTKNIHTNTDKKISQLVNDFLHGEVKMNTTLKKILFEQIEGNISLSEFKENVEGFLAQWKHDGTGNEKLTGRTYKELTYEPMSELLDYLRANDFKIFLCSGGSNDFMRVFAEELYEIPHENVIGSFAVNRYVFGAGIEPEDTFFYKQIANFHNTSHGGKPEAINAHTGRIPIFSAGNVLNGGDIAHLTFCKSNPLQSFQLLINHDDAEREVAYAEKNDPSIKAGKAQGWSIVSMKNDWKKVFRNPEVV
ncbi:HAD family hydrolase [Kordia jejudonensis]|uniref:haloacid dehalogenase-like hydrolase n=1 Tax=Kordia jejudonensis TaxID=1348245 RepID=UPI0006291DF6|nr:haloacid dehalogenase-like hydrolase [Kordia jejudonensis]